MTGATAAIDVDARGFEPPQPMIEILTALETLPEGAVLRGRTDRRPLLLHDLLIKRGCRFESNEEPDGSWLTLIWRG